jgi:LysM repeat protein
VHDDPATALPPPVTAQPGDPAASRVTGVAHPTTIGVVRSPDMSVCPFLRAIDDDDALDLPIESPDPANRCAALRDPVPQSLRQQELVCLTSGHVNCPRYLRGSLASAEPLERVHPSLPVTRATAGALSLFALAFAVSLAFVVANGGLVLSAAAPTPTAAGDVLGEIETAPATAAQTPTPSAPPTASPTATATASPSPVASPSPTPTPSTSPSPTPSAKRTAKPTSNRFALLKPCPDTPSCYIYVIRSGDNLYSIANYFGVSLTRVQAMNPWTSGGLTAGRQLRIPPPTR